MQKTTQIKVSHIEVSDGDTVIVSSETCPLTKDTVFNKKQLRFDTICCKITGQGKDYNCPCFYSANLDKGKFTVNCRYD